MEEIDNTPSVKVYPNPVSQQLHVVMETNQLTTSERINLKLVNLSGKVVIDKEVLGNQSVINLDMVLLPSGEYTLVMTSLKLKFTQKVIKN